MSWCQSKISGLPWTHYDNDMHLIESSSSYLAISPKSRCQADAVPEVRPTVTPMITFKDKMHVMSKPRQLILLHASMNPVSEWKKCERVEFSPVARMRHHQMQIQRTTDPLCPVNFPQPAYRWLKAGRRATIWRLLKVNTCTKGEVNADPILRSIGFFRRCYSKAAVGRVWGSSEQYRWCSRLVDPWESLYLFFVGTAYTDHAHCCARTIEARVNEPRPPQHEDVPTDWDLTPRDVSADSRSPTTFGGWSAFEFMSWLI